MRYRGIQRWIIRHPDGRLVYYPWTWYSTGAMSAYVVGSPSVMRPTLRRQRIVLWFLLPGAVLSFASRLHPLLTFGFDLVFVWLVGRWILLDLTGSSVKLPRLLAVKLAATRRHVTDDEVAKLTTVVLMTSVIACLPGLAVSRIIFCTIFLGVLLMNLWVSITIRRMNRESIPAEPAAAGQSTVCG